MIVNIDPRDPRPLYLQIMDEVRRALVGGSLGPDQPLPSVRELASELVVNPRTVLQAYQELERLGVVYVKRGQGTFAAAAIESPEPERQQLARSLARRALLDARRMGLSHEELVRTIDEVAHEEDDEPSSPAPAVSHRGEALS